MRLPRLSPHVAVLTGLGLASSAAGAEASTHHFAPSQDVVVSLELRKPRVTGKLVSFARNRVALSRTRSGHLVLKAKGSKPRRVAGSGHRSVRVSVALSARHGSAKLIAGGRKASLPGRFVAEDAVSVRSGDAVRSLRITRSHSPDPVAATNASTPSPAARALAPATATSPTSTPDPTPPPGRLFAADSVWNKPVPTVAPIDPESPVLVTKLSNTIKDGFTAGRASWIQSGSGSTPLYVVPAGAPTVRVTLDAGAWATSLQQALDAVPMPSNAAPAAGIDAQMTIWQPSTNRLWEFFKVKKLADGWHASYGGAISGVTTYPGYYSDFSWPGLSHSYWGATGTSLPMIAGTMRLSELSAGVIPHALAVNIPYARKKIYSWPAQRSDGTSTDPGAIPEGAHFRLDPALDLSKLNLPPMTRMMATAAQRYGLIIRDQTNWAVSVFAEDPTPTGTSPFGGPTGFYGGRQPSDLMKAFPWDRLQLLQMDLHTQ